MCPCLMPKPPQLTHFDVEEQLFYSEPFLNGQAPHPIFKVEATDLWELIVSTISFFWSLPRPHDLGEGKDVDQPVAVMGERQYDQKSNPITGLM